MLQLGIYKHYKGGVYKVLGVAKSSEDYSDLVVYEALYDNSMSKLWVRPLEDFLAEVEVEGKKVKRFEFIED